MFKVQEISYQAGKKKLLNKVSFEANTGELLAILGANGAGKTTLMKLLCNELKPLSGKIIFNETDLQNYKPQQLAKLRSVLPQNHSLSVSFTVLELVTMGRYPHFNNKPSAKDIEIIAQVMDETGISHLANRDYNTLSGGEQQRAQFARVFAQIYDTPQATLLLDEPTNGLDLLYQQQLMVLAKNLTNKGYCVVCILHDINFATRFADKILMLKNGEIVAYGYPIAVVNCENIHKTYNINVKLMQCEGYDCPLVVH